MSKQRREFKISMTDMISGAARRIANEELPAGDYSYASSYQITICEGKAEVSDITIWFERKDDA